MNSVALNILNTAKDWNCIQVSLCTHCCLSHTHEAVDLTRAPTTAAAGLQTKQCNPQIREKHLCGERRRLQLRSFCTERQGLGPSVTVENNTTQHLPINPHLSRLSRLGVRRPGLAARQQIWRDVVAAGCGEKEGCWQWGGGSALSQGDSATAGPSTLSKSGVCAWNVS